MSRRCELTGKGTLVGNNVSHANNKTKRIYRPNLQIIALASEVLGNSYKLKISMNALRSVDRNGGLDPFILKCQGQRAVAQGAAPEARHRQEGRRPRPPKAFDLSASLTTVRARHRALRGTPEAVSKRRDRNMRAAGLRLC